MGSIASGKNGSMTRAIKTANGVGTESNVIL